MNPHGLPHTPLKRTRLPVPPPARKIVYFLVGGADFAGSPASGLALSSGVAPGTAGACRTGGAAEGNELVTLLMPERPPIKVKRSEVMPKVTANQPVNWRMKLVPEGV